MKKTLLSALLSVLSAAAFAQTVPQWGFNEGPPRELLYRGKGMSAYQPLNAAPHVATNAELASAGTVNYPNGIWRDDYSTGAGADPLWFTPLTGTCAANSLVNDGGYCVNSTSGDGNSWRAWHPESGVGVLQFGADKTGVVDSAAAFAGAVSTGGRKVAIPCGTFLLASVVALSSNTELVGSGSCTTLKASASMANNPRYAEWYGGTLTTGKNIVSNEHFAGTDHDIYVHDFATDGTLVTSGTMHHITFASASNVRVERVKFLGAGDAYNQNATAFIGESHHYTVKDNYAEGTMNACFDQWDGAHDFLIEGNTCEGGGYVLNGVQVNGISSGSPRIGRSSHDFRIIGNEVRDTEGTPISIRGLCVGAVCGSVDHGEVIGNTVDGVSAGGAKVPGILVGDGSDIGVGFNAIKNTRGSCIVVAGELAASVTRNVVVANTTCQNVNTAGAGGTTDNGIYVGNSADAPAGVSVIGNTIRGGNYSYAIRVFSSSTNVNIVPGNMTAGTSGMILYPASVNPQVSGFSNNIATGAAVVDTTWKTTATSDTMACGVLVGGQGRCDSTSVMLFRRSGVTKWTVDTSVNTSGVPVKLPVYTVATLPACGVAQQYAKAYVSDSNAALTAGIGAVVAGGGSNIVPVGCDGTNWRIGG